MALSDLYTCTSSVFRHTSHHSTGYIKIATQICGIAVLFPDPYVLSLLNKFTLQ